MKIAVTIVVGQLSQSQRLELESSQQRHDREAPASNSPIQLDLPLGRMGSRGYRGGSACLRLPHPCGHSEQMAEGQDLHFIMQKEAPRGKGGRETQWWSPRARASWKLLFLCMLDDDADVGSRWEEKYDGHWLDSLSSW